MIGLIIELIIDIVIHKMSTRNKLIVFTGSVTGIFLIIKQLSN